MLPYRILAQAYKPTPLYTLVSPLRMPIRSLSTSSSSPIRPHKDRSTFELLNSLLVFRLCTIPFVVQTTPTLIEWAEKLKLSRPMYAVIKQTFFRHFCGGEDLKEVLPTMKKLEQNQVGSILDLAMEADVDDAVVSSPMDAQQHANKIRLMMQESVDIAAHQPDSFIAVKVTAMVPPPILMRWTNSLNTLRLLFETKGKTKTINEIKEWLMEVGVSKEETEFLCSKLPRTRQVNAFYPHYRPVDWMDFTEYASPIYPQTRQAFLVKHHAVSSGEFATLVKEDFDTIDAVIPELKGLCEYARQHRVRIMMDAEQTYFQRAIDDVALYLIRTINPHVQGDTTPLYDKAVVFNTYQMYLKDALDRLQQDVVRSQRQGFSFGAKIVRGAYMNSERERAKELGIQDPIQPTLSDTHSNYNKAIDFLVSNIQSSPSSHVKALSMVAASHNKESIEKTISSMKMHQVSPKDGTVGFAQLLGMQDGTSVTLGQLGYSCYKYIPYGPIAITIPYLIRRAQENSSLMKGSGVSEDLKGLYDELKQRMSLSS